jgi:CheY-like chemotaxis protein
MSFYVLVVDDEESIRGFLRRRLEGWGYPVKEAASATEALDRMMTEPAAIAIIDVQMPGRNGLWLLDQIRQGWSKTAVILTSEADEATPAEASRRSVAIDYVFKPFDRELLQNAVVRATEAASES